MIVIKIACVKIRPRQRVRLASFVSCMVQSTGDSQLFIMIYIVGHLTEACDRCEPKTFMFTILERSWQLVAVDTTFTCLGNSLMCILCLNILGSELSNLIKSKVIKSTCQNIGQISLVRWQRTRWFGRIFSAISRTDLNSLSLQLGWVARTAWKRC